jgi:hypothetical protein
VIRPPAARPKFQKGESLRSVAGRALNYGDENAARLNEGRQNYGRIRGQYAAGAR